MEAGQLFLLVVMLMYLYCTGASWMLQVVCYPTYLLVGEKEFVPFHVDFGKRLLVAAVIPMVLTIFATFALVFVLPGGVPLWMALVVAACSAVTFITTVALEVPKHNRLDKEGKSDALIHALVRDNLPRVAAWTLGSVTLAAMLVSSWGG